MPPIPKTSYYRPVQKVLRHEPPRSPLTNRDQIFIDCYVRTADPVKAAEEAGIENGLAYVKRKIIAAAISALQYRRQRTLHVEQDYVLRRWLEIERADPREISEIWRVPCRYCHGDNHHYQWRDELEYQDKLKALPEAKRQEFDDLGGYGYSIRMPIHSTDNGYDHDCPKCDGLGNEYIYFHDTRDYKPGAVALYKSAKVTAGGGFEVLMHDQENARQMVAKHMGYFGAAPAKSPKEMTEEEVDAILAAHGSVVDGDCTTITDVPAGEGGSLVGVGEGAETSVLTGTSEEF